MPTSSARLALTFSCLGHAYMHMFAALYFVIVLELERDWGLPYHELIEYWTLGALLVGLGALPAGWLADRWSAPGMMVVMFLGMGASALYCGLFATPDTMIAGLAALGLFASIYHPVGIAWVVRSARARGKALGINGIFGSAGVAGAAIVAGSLIDLHGWRAAFVVPGAVSVATGLVLLYLLRSGAINDRKCEERGGSASARTEMVRGFVILVLTMLCVGLIFQSMQTALPKVLSLRLSELLGQGTLGVGAVVAGVYTVAGLMQVIGGHLADRLPLKALYASGLLLQVPALALVAELSGVPLMVAAMMAVLLNAGILPAENLLLARFTPPRHHSLAYGVKFVLTFATAPLAILLVSWIAERTGEFQWLYFGTAGLAAIALSAALMLPGVRAAPARLATEST